MAGFYGRISNTNKSAFTFDITYPSRVVMDERASDDGVFIGRYVEVEYDDPPLTGYKDGDNFYNDAMHTSRITPVNNRIYQDLHHVNEIGSFWTWNATAHVFVQVTSEAQSTFAFNYNKDVARYGRGYDSTAWVKTVDSSTGEYRYVMVAELNTVVPNFHLVADPPSATPVAPYFDSNTTTLDYYMHVPAQYGWRINQATDRNMSDERIVYQEASWNQSSQSYDVYTTAPEGVPGDIFYNRAGFSKDERHFVDIGKYYTEDYPDTFSSIDTINYTMGSSGRLYYGTNGQGQTRQDILLWHIYLPSIGNAICEVWDHMFTSERKLAFLQENGVQVVGGNKQYCTLDTGSVLGIANSLRAYIGQVEKINSALTNGYTLPAQESQYHTTVRYIDSEDIRQYLYPTYTNVWTEYSGDVATATDTLYYYDSETQSYRVANTAALPANTTYYRRDGGTDASPYITYKKSYERDLRTVSTGGLAAVNADRATHGDLPNTIYGAIAYINRIMGGGLKSEDSRDDRTIIGLMNRMKDIILDIDSKLVPNRWLITNASGQITTNAVQYTTPIAGGVLDSVGNWVPRVYQIQTTGESNAVTELTANDLIISAENDALKVIFATGNKWIRLAANNTSKTVTIAHMLCGISAATVAPSATGWANSGNALNIPEFEFDEAGHIIRHTTQTFYLPNYFGTYSVTGSSNSDTGSTGANSISIVPDQVADVATFATANKWITINCDNNTITWGHAASGVTAASYGLAADEAVTDLDADNRFEVPYFTVDNAGHITAATTHTITLPESIHTLTVAVGNTGVNQLTVAAEPTSIVADSLEDAMTFYAANKWIRLVADPDNDEIKFAHEIHSVTETTPTINFNDNNKLTFTADELTWDEAGHLVTRAKTTYTLPYNWKTIAVANTLAGVGGLTAANSSAVATNPIDTVTITAQNKWLLFSASGTAISVAHALSGTGAVANKGTGTTVSTEYGMKFKVPYLSIDEAGHVTALTDTELTMPSISLTNGTGNVVVSLALNTTSGAFTETRANIGTLEITGYAVATTSAALAATDTLNAALGKLEKRLNVIENDYLVAADLNPYLLSQTAADTYLTKTDATNTYLTQTNAASTYLSQTDASSTYLTQTDATNTYLTQTDAASTYQAKEDSEDPYAITSYVDQAVADAVAAIERNYSLTLIAPTVNTAYAENTITVTVNSFDGTGSIWLEKNDIMVSAITTIDENELPSYPIAENGTYRVAVQRNYNGATIIGYSSNIIVDDIVTE